jgi:hypothetical protein
MADVNIQQAPQPVQTGGGSGAVWGIVVLILLAVIAWFVFGGPIHRTRTTINVNTPSAPGASAPSPSGGSAAPPASPPASPPAGAPPGGAGGGRG